MRERSCTVVLSQLINNYVTMRKMLLAKMWLVFTVQLYAQHDLAIVFTEIPPSEVVGLQIRDELQQSFKEQGGFASMAYLLKDDEIQFLPELSSVQEEKTADYAFYYIYNIGEDYQPDLSVKRSKEGKITSVGFSVTKSARVWTKMIRISTGEIVHVTDHGQVALPSLLAIKDYQKYFGSDPDALKASDQKAFAAALQKARSAYNGELRKYFAAKKSEVKEVILSSASTILMDEPVRPAMVEVVKDKAKVIKFEMNSEIQLPASSFLHVFTTDTIGDYVSSEIIGNYFVAEQAGREVTIKPAVFESRSGSLAEQYQNGKDLFIVATGYKHGRKLGAEFDDIVVGFQFGKLTASHFEESLSGLDNITLVDLGSMFLINKLRERYKQEQFIEEDFMAKSLGVKYLLVLKDRSINIIDVETGAVKHTFSRKAGFGGMYDVAMQLFDREIELVKVSQQKKDKANKLILYSPLGFQAANKLQVYRLEQINVGGEIKERSVLIGVCKAGIRASQIKEFNVSKGGKEILKAISNGDTLRFRQGEYGI